MGKIKDKFYAYPKPIRVLAVAMVINTMGMSMLFPLNTLYITKILDGSMAVAGFILMIQQGFNIIGNILGGWSYDRFGAKKTIVTGITFSTILVFTLIFISDISIYAVLLVLLGLGNGLIFPSIYAMAGALWPEGGRKTYNLIYVSNNLGVAFGPIVGGIAFQFAPRLIFVAYTTTFVFFLMLVLLGFTKENWKNVIESSIEGRIQTTSEQISFGRKYINFAPLMLLSLGFLLTWVPYSQWSTSISVHMNDIGIEYSKYTLLWSINGLIIVLGQPLIAYITNNLLKSLKSQLYTGLSIFIVAFAILFFNPFYYYGFVIAMAIITFGEMLAFPAVPAAAAELAPSNRKGLYQGIIGGFGAGGRMFGVLLAGLLYDLIDIKNMYLLMLGLLLLSIICIIIYSKLAASNERKYNTI
ncbi:MAG: MFS transporter [Vulcanibacillus sp.]